MQLNDDFTSRVNMKILSEISEKYLIETISIFEDEFDCYKLHKKKGLIKTPIYLCLPKNYLVSQNVKDVLKKITDWEQVEEKKTIKYGEDYVCVLPIENGTDDMSIFCNGLSFCYFIMCDLKEKSVIYEDKASWYRGDKRIREVICICRNILIQGIL